MTDVMDSLADKISEEIGLLEIELTRLSSAREKAEESGSTSEVMNIASAMLISAGRYQGMCRAWEMAVGQKWPEPELQG